MDMDDSAEPGAAWLRQILPGEAVTRTDTSDKQSKGTFAHFRSAFPDDPCWNSP